MLVATFRILLIHCTPVLLYTCTLLLHTLYSVLFYSVLCTLLLSTLYFFTLYSVLCTLCSVLCTLDSVLCTPILCTPVLLQVTASVIYHVLNTLHVTIDVREVCVFLAPFFSSLTAIVTYLLTSELHSVVSCH